MHRFSHYRPSPAMIVACVALVIALGGTSYAAIVLPAGSVGTKQLKANAVIGSKVKDGSLTLADISSASLSKFSRIGIGSGSTVMGAGSLGTVATVSLTVPRTGFVLVTGYVDEFDCNGAFGVKVYDDTAGTSSPWNNTMTATSGTEFAAGNTAVFPVTAGVRVFSVRISWNTSSTSFDTWGTVTAQFIPYGATGSKTSLAITKNKMLAPPQH